LSLVTRPVGWFVVKYVPLAGYVQFPWRMFLFAACTAPLCAPVAVDAFFPRAWARWLIAVGIAVVVIAVFAPQYGPSAPLVRVHIHSEPFLRSIETDYVTSMNEYLPKTVRRTVPRFGPVAHVVAGSADLLTQNRSAGSYSVSADVHEDAVLEFNAHWFPGWRAFVDGSLQPIGPGENTFDNGGLIRVRLPNGQHHVELVFRRTSVRLLCDLVSLFALVITLLLLGSSAFRRLRHARTRSAPDASVGAAPRR